MLDSVVLGVAGSVPLSMAGLYDFKYPDFPDRTGFVLALLVAAVLNVVYFVWFWTGGRRATPGQRVFGIQVANAFDGRPLTLRQAITRWIGLGLWVGYLYLLPFKIVAIWGIIASLLWTLVLLVTTVVSPTKQGIHDQLAGSALVRPGRSGNGWAIVFLTVLAIFAVLEGAALIAAVGLGSPYMPTDFWDRYIRWLWPS